MPSPKGLSLPKRWRNSLNATRRGAVYVHIYFLAPIHDVGDSEHEAYSNLTERPDTNCNILICVYIWQTCVRGASIQATRYYVRMCLGDLFPTRCEHVCAQTTAAATHTRSTSYLLLSTAEMGSSIEKHFRAAVKTRAPLYNMINPY